MILTLTGSALATALLAGEPPPSPLAAFTDHARVLVVSAVSPNDPELRRQEVALSGSHAALGERQVVVISAVGPIAHDDQGRPMDAAGLRTAVGLPAASFGVALVGKDGGVKLKRRKAIAAAQLIGTIDAMPMRRQEMRRGVSK